MGDVDFGNPKTPECCGKPRGCDMTHEGCVFLRHPWKRAMVFGDTDVRCQMTWIPDAWSGGDRQVQCVLRHGHDGPCAARRGQ